MSEKTSKGEDKMLDEAIRYVIAASKGQSYKYPEGWDKNMKRSVRKRADRVTVRGVEVVYKKDKAEVRIIQSSDEQMRILEMCHSDPTSCHFGVKMMNRNCQSGEVEIFDSLVKDEVFTTEQNSGHHLQLRSKVDLEHLRQLATNRTEWSQLTKRVVKAAQAKLT